MTRRALFAIPFLAIAGKALPTRQPQPPANHFPLFGETIRKTPLKEFTDRVEQIPGVRKVDVWTRKPGKNYDFMSVHYYLPQGVKDTIWPRIIRLRYWYQSLP